MKDRLFRMGFTLLSAVCLLSTCGIATSCQDNYDLDEKMPEILGQSIYDELKKEGNFTNQVRLIDDLGYTDVLSKTGSKTLFVANDDAFRAFFEKCTWKDGSGQPVRSYDQLSTSQKRLLLNGAMLNNAYVMEMLANTAGGGKNLCLRQGTNQSATDSVPYWNYWELPKFQFEAEEDSRAEDKMDLWSYYRTEARGGMYMAVDATNPMMTHFLEGQLNDKHIKHSDIAFIMNIKDGSWGTNSETEESRSYIYDRRVITPDKTCLNGYYHVLDSVLVTPSSMAEVIREEPTTQLFSEMLERFSAPYYVSSLTAEYSALHDIKGDSVFQKRYISVNNYSGAPLQQDQKRRSLGDFPQLAFDPAWNAYAISSTTTAENDMAAMFVPSDAAMKDYFVRGGGRFLMERYAKRENTDENLSYNIAQIPLQVVAALINNLMKDSFNETVPSKYLTIMNDAQDQMFPAKTYGSEEEYRALFEKVKMASNGVVYIMNKVISPADYSSVAAPVLLSRNTRIVNAVLRADEAYINGNSYNNAPLKQYFSTYLKAMQSRFSFFVPTDEGLGKYGYVDPVGIASKLPASIRYWRFEYGAPTSTDASPRLPIRATSYRYNAETGPLDSDQQTQNKAVSLPNEVLTTGYGPTKRELMVELVNQHVIVHDNDDTQGVNASRTIYTSRSGAPVVIVNRGDAANNGVGMQVKGGYQIDLENDEYPGNEYVSNVIEGHNMTEELNGYGNGMTYVIDRPMQPTMTSVYSILSRNENFSAFFELCDPMNFSEDLLVSIGFKDSIAGKKDETTLWSAEQNKYRIFTNLAPYYPAANEYLVRFFNNYRYTIYVPTNAAVQEAIRNGLPTWASIEEFVEAHKDADGLLNDDDKAKAKAMVTCLVNFLRYHFQDGAYYVDNVNYALNGQTSCIMHNDATDTDAYLYVQMNQTPNHISLKDEAGKQHNVVAPYNLMARDMNFNAAPTNTTSARYVKNSSYAAIHQVDGVLNFMQLPASGRYDAAWSTAPAARKFVAKYRIRK
ncbi:MAG: hypothetical protein IJ692_01825 [Alloprevotella sp.]|nr:hypothetical protein [Alloprevotella sp.]MBR1652111.1 hypothetical protein [Alloprevotella sp.]